MELPKVDGSAYRDILERAQARAREHHFDAVVVTSMDGRIVDWNPGSERLYGYARHEVLGRRVDLLHVPEDRDHVLSQVMAGIQAAGRWEGEIRMLRKDGTTGWVESAVVPVTDDAGQAVAMLGINRDVTARVEAERERGQAEARFRSLAENSLVGIHIVRDGRFLYANPKLAEILGYSVPELLADVAVLELVVEEDRDFVRDQVRRRFAGERLDYPYSFRVRRKDGSILVLEVHGNRIEVDGGYAVLGMVQDVTRQREAERELREREAHYRSVAEETLERAAAVLAARGAVRDRYLGTGEDQPTPLPGVRDEDQRFLLEVRAAIERNLADETYNVERLARDLGQSRSNLHRRLRGLVDETPSDLLWRMRLERGAQLLERTGEPVAAIAHVVGFKSTAHFSNRFAQHFGHRPSEARGERGSGEEPACDRVDSRRDRPA